MDDILTVGDATVIGDFHDWLSSKWEFDPVAMMAADKPIRLLGMEIQLGEVGHSCDLSQKGFIEELLHAHDHKRGKSWSMGSRDLLMLMPEEEEELLQDIAPLNGSSRAIRPSSPVSCWRVALDDVQNTARVAARYGSNGKPCHEIP